jgi:predicted transcriptional regulator
MSLESIGIYPTSTKSQRQALVTPQPAVSYIPGSIPLEQLGNDTSREILQGSCPTGDRSEALATAVQEWYGWQNWTRENGIAVTGTPEDLAHYAGGQLGIDNDRVDRVLKTIDIIASNPAALHRGGEESCWKKVRRLDKASFEAKCPAHIKDVVKAAWQRSGNVTYKKPSIREVIAKAEQILKARFNSQLDSIEANILLEELRQEAGLNDYNWEQKYLKPLREKLERSLALPDTENQPSVPTAQTERRRLELLALSQERDPDKFIDDRIAFCRRYGWSRQEVEQRLRQLKTSTTTPKAKRLKGKDFLSLETESISWVFPGIIPSRGVFVIGGHAGAGKTTFAYDAVGSLLLCEEFLGENPVKAGKVLIVTGDELPCFTQDKLIDRGIPLDNEDWDIILNWDVTQWDVLEEAIADLRPALVVIDSFSSIHRDPSFDENSSQAKSTIYDLEALTNAYNCGCILIHHLSKSKENQGVAKLRGSSAIAAAASVVCLMEQTSDGSRRLSFPKVRGAQTDPFLAHLDGSTGRYEVVSGGDDPGTKSLGDRILTFLQKSPHKRFEQDEISEALGIPYTQKDSVYQALGRLFKRGLITKRPSRLGGKRKVYAVNDPYSYSDNNQCATSSRNVTDNLTDKPQDTPPPSPLNVSVQISERTDLTGLELTDTLTDKLTDTKLTHQNDVHAVSLPKPEAVGVSAKLTDKGGQGCVSPLSVPTVTPSPTAEESEEAIAPATAIQNRPEDSQPQQRWAWDSQTGESLGEVLCEGKNGRVKIRKSGQLASRAGWYPVEQITYRNPVTAALSLNASVTSGVQWGDDEQFLEELDD